MMVFGEGIQSRIWTSFPGVIQSYDPTKRTCVVQPALKALVEDVKGVKSWVNLPLLVDCPVQFPSGGGLTLSFPLTQGDECIVVFSARCLDAWWQLGGVQVQAELRMHDLSDGMVIPGLRSVPNVEPALSTNSAQLRTFGGDTLVEVTTSGEINITASSSVNVTAPGITLNGPVTINGPLTATGTVTAPVVNGITDVQFGGKSGVSHIHSGVQSGSQNTGAPV